MTEEKQNIAIYKLLGYQPRKMWRFWADKDKTYGYLSLPSKEEALKRIEEEKNSWFYKEYKSEYEFSEPEEYDDWYDLPNVGLNLMNRAENEWFHETTSWEAYRDKLIEVRTPARHPESCISADAEERREALLKTLNLWEE